MISKLFRKKRSPEPVWEKRTLYVYRPQENAIVYRVEYRDDFACIYRGWSKVLAWRMEEEKLFAPDEQEPSYIIIGSNICDSSGKALYRIADGGVYRAGDKAACLVIRNSIVVQGTL